MYGRRKMVCAMLEQVRLPDLATRLQFTSAPLFTIAACSQSVERYESSPVLAGEWNFYAHACITYATSLFIDTYRESFCRI